jgi:hypothetical protein
MGSFSGLPIELGAGKEVRTPDLYLGKVSLYQLSYSRITGKQFSKLLDSAPYLLPIVKFILLVSYAIKALVRLTEQLGQRFLQVIEHRP